MAILGCPLRLQCGQITFNDAEASAIHPIEPTVTILDCVSLDDTVDSCVFKHWHGWGGEHVDKLWRAVIEVHHSEDYLNGSYGGGEGQRVERKGEVWREGAGIRKEEKNRA